MSMAHMGTAVIGAGITISASLRQPRESQWGQYLPPSDADVSKWDEQASPMDVAVIASAAQVAYRRQKLAEIQEAMREPIPYVTASDFSSQFNGMASSPPPAHAPELPKPKPVVIQQPGKRKLFLDEVKV